MSQSPEIESPAVSPPSKSTGASPGHPHLLVAAMPKSGSTFLADVIEALPGVKRAVLAPSFGRREQELDESCIQKIGDVAYVAQHHVRYSDWTAKLCSDYGLQPVVLVRSLPDLVVSMRDHLRRESTKSPLFFAEPHHAELDDATLERMIVRLAVPWCVNFYMCWRHAPGALLASYEQLTADPVGTVSEIMEFHGLGIPEDEIVAAVERVRKRRQSRLNVGVAGRGAGLQPQTMRDLIGLLDFYPEAASDLYFQGMRAQAAAALEGRAVPKLGRVALASQRPEATRAAHPVLPSQVAAEKYVALAKRYGYQIFLVGLAIVYWVLPRDLIPDDLAYGKADDVVILLVLAYAAGRVNKRTPSLRNLALRCQRLARKWARPAT